MNHQLLTHSYLVLIIAAFMAWFGLVRSLPAELSYRKLVWLVLLLCLPLIFSYNALSHDVFNYIFNAKMVVVYQEDPHVQVALSHADDSWTRFMHNTHTPAPYGYGWTIFSLLPFSLGMGKFILTWLAFRGLNVLAIPILFWLLIKLGRTVQEKIRVKDFALVFLNPLFLIEVISNQHNDLWMLIPAVASMLVLYRTTKKQLLSGLLISLLLLLLSISTKMATVVLLPFWLLRAAQLMSQTKVGKQLPMIVRNWSDLLANLALSNFGFIASVLLFLPLLSSRSQYFHPWYLVWSLIWLPLISVKWWKQLLVVFTVSSLLRYVPWLQAGGFADNVLQQQQAVTWLGAVIGLGLVQIWRKVRSSHET